jgi:hypothetical protein
MCQLCSIATRFARVRQESLVFNLSQFASAIAAQPTTETPQNQPVTLTQKKSP